MKETERNLQYYIERNFSFTFKSLKSFHLSNFILITLILVLVLKIFYHTQILFQWQTLLSSKLFFRVSILNINFRRTILFFCTQGEPFDRL